MSINPSTENVPGEGSPAKQQEDQKLPKAQDNRNELSAWQKIMAGILLIAFTLSAILLVIGYWPNKAPIQNGSSTYSNSLFHINLIDAPNKIGVTLSRDKLHKACDSCLVTNKDTIVFKIKAAKVDTLLKFVATDGNKNGQSYDILQQGMYDTPNGTIQYDVLLLILVALCGFLGNMIHMATSFTAFVGANKFAKSWLLWYYVKPFTASGLALALYFVFRAGFLNQSVNDGGSINLYGVLTIAMLAGMFTDRATSKLRDIFDVAFKAKEDRPNGLQGPRVISISPDKIDKANPTTITVTGSGFDNTLIIKIDGAPVAVSASNIKPSTIVFSYSVPAAKAGATQFALDILDKNNAVLFSKTLGVL